MDGRGRAGKPRKHYIWASEKNGRTRTEWSEMPGTAAELKHVLMETGDVTEIEWIQCIPEFG